MHRPKEGTGVVEIVVKSDTDWAGSKITRLLART
jgi:hypothetical protein